MKITERMINWFEFPNEITKLALAPYMECPPGEWDYIMQHHWRGRSVHVDWRMEVNDHLNGWTVLDNPKGTPKVETMEEAERADASVKWQFNAKNVNIGRRAETKARQPKEWIKVKGVIKPGQVGATKGEAGVITWYDKGKVIFGVQKPYFHEYFVKSSMGKAFPSDTWTRIVIRRVGVPALTPEKQPTAKKEVMWRVLVPSDQEPYQISNRAHQKGYKPPKENPVQFPEEWAKKKFPEQYGKWLEWKGEKKVEKTCKTCYKFNLGKCTDPETLANPDRLGCKNWIHIDLIKSLESLPFADYKNMADCIAKNQDKEDPGAYCATIARKTGELKSSAKFVLHFNSWMGQFVVRGVPRREWYLRLDDKGQGKIRSFFFDQDPTYFSPVSAEDEGRIDRKWLTFEGKLEPRTIYNPNKKIPAFMRITDKGTVDIDSKSEEGLEIITLKFNGHKLKGKWRLIQEEKGSSTFTMEELTEDLEGLTFALQKHWIPLQEGAKFPEDYGFHWDIRLSNGTEFNLYSDPVSTPIEEWIKAKRKTCKEIKEWMTIDKEHTMKMVGPLVTFVDPIDKGKAEVFEMTPDFMSMKFHGDKLIGYFVYKRNPDGDQIFIKSKLPKAKLAGTGDPSTGNFFKPFEFEQKKGWDYYWLYIYAPEDFTRCLVDWKEYLKDLSKPSEILDILVCLYPRPGTIHGARVEAVKVSNNWTKEQATDWIKQNKLHTWAGELIRKKHEEKKSLEDITLEKEKLQQEKEELERRVAETKELLEIEKLRKEIEFLKKKEQLLTQYEEAQKE